MWSTGQGKLILSSFVIEANLHSHIAYHISWFFKSYSVVIMNSKNILEILFSFSPKKGTPAKVPVKREKQTRKFSNPIDANL